MSNPRHFRIALLPLLLLPLGCSRAKVSDVAQSTAVKEGTPAATAAPPLATSKRPDVANLPKPLPASLPTCKDPADPLSALCTISADASKARFECDAPSPVAFCGNGDDWVCSHSVFGPKAPEVTFHAKFDRNGPKIVEGQAMDMKLFKRSGPIRGVAIHFATDTAGGERKAKELGDKLATWGCEESKAASKVREFDCGTWQASVEWMDILKHVIVSAAEKGKLRCE